MRLGQMFRVDRRAPLHLGHHGLDAVAVRHILRKQPWASVWYFLTLCIPFLVQHYDAVAGDTVADIGSSLE